MISPIKLTTAEAAGALDCSENYIKLQAGLGRIKIEDGLVNYESLVGYSQTREDDLNAEKDDLWWNEAAADAEDGRIVAVLASEIGLQEASQLTSAEPGSLEKQAIMRARVRLGLPLHMAGDEWGPKRVNNTASFAGYGPKL
jgi:hypothetical protein